MVPSDNVAEPVTEKAPFGPTTVLPNCVVVAKILLPPVKNTLAFVRSFVGLVQPVVESAKLLTLNGDVLPVTTTCTLITALFMALLATPCELFTKVVVQEVNAIGTATGGVHV